MKGLALMSNISVGNVVRIGKGNTEYEVVSITEGFAALKGEKTSRKAVALDTLTVVPHASLEALNAVLGVQTPEIKDAPVVEIVAQDIAVSATKDALTLIVDGHAVRAKGSFETLAFQLSRLKGTYAVASIARNGKALVTRYAA